MNGQTIENLNFIWILIETLHTIYHFTILDNFQWQKKKPSTNGIRYGKEFTGNFNGTKNVVESNIVSKQNTLYKSTTLMEFFLLLLT